ncbi:chymotrypsin inhibitor-like [Hyperolius riggenbachi]|uniref:chymotrypsin inhibitor-like n=1 Tax=Hyperolius riggenbachi TaxID=752182 RepID=UPI0035A31D74
MSLKTIFLLITLALISLCHAAPEDCGPDKEFDKCGTACPESCENFGQIVICNKMCVPGCVCKKSFILKADGSDTCILQENCPKIYTEYTQGSRIYS